MTNDDVDGVDDDAVGVVEDYVDDDVNAIDVVAADAATILNFLKLLCPLVNVLDLKPVMLVLLMMRHIGVEFLNLSLVGCVVDDSDGGPVAIGFLTMMLYYYCPSMSFDCAGTGVAMQLHRIGRELHFVVPAMNAQPPFERLIDDAMNDDSETAGDSVVAVDAVGIVGDSEMPAQS